MNTLVDLLGDSRDRFPRRTALVMRQGYRVDRWTYQRLWETSCGLAACLQQRGLAKGDRVVLWAQNSPQWVAAFFGCLRLGAVVVPLDVRSTNEFARKVVVSTQPKLAFVSAATAQGGKGLGLPLVALEGMDELTAGSSPSPMPVEVNAYDLAEIIFTSGTTGDPKGVMLTHGNIVANVRSATQVVPVEPGFRLLSLLPLSHMLEQTVGTLSPLMGGASVYYPQSRQPSVIFRAFNEYGITSLVLVPQALQLFMDAIEVKVREQGKERTWASLLRMGPGLPVWARRRLFTAVHRRLGGRLRFVMCGGAYLDPALAQKWEAMGVRVLQGYGTTEASPIIACNSFAHARLDSLGRPIPGVDVRIARDGEILVRGPNVTPGYWRNSAATRDAFSAGWYKTGDLGSLSAEGFLYFKGRKKDAIVLPSGMNVYPEDIEAVLRRHPVVRDAAVVGLPKGGQQVEVHAALLLKVGHTDAKAVVDVVNAALADHQRVQGFTVWPDDDFPRTNTLKIKKHEVLQRLLQAATEAKEQPKTPSPVQTASPLLRLAAQVARKPVDQATPSARLGAELGLDSLGRVELLSVIESEFGVYLDEAQVSGDTTLAELESLAQQAARESGPSAYARWPLHPLTQALRSASQALLFRTVVPWFAPTRIQGVERLAGLRGPVIFAANHQSHADTPVILAALPKRFRRRVAVAAAADHWFAQGRLAGMAAAFLLNAFPFSRSGSIRPSLEHCSRLLDGSWSILIFPEGTRSADGRMGQFKSGTGFMAVELGVPVVPVHVEGTGKVLPKGKGWPRRGHVQVTFGEPLRFAPGTSYVEATQALEAAVRALAGVNVRENQPVATA